MSRYNQGRDSSQEYVAVFHSSSGIPGFFPGGNRPEWSTASRGSRILLPAVAGNECALHHLAEEKGIFQNLSTSQEKDHFIEQFWFRRDLDPRTAVNEFKEEHYRRIAYANDTYHSGIEGWRTDREMIYILFGPPDGLEKHPEGGTYQRKWEEGGGRTYTYPFEVWFYRHLEGVGPGIEIEFVDASRTNQYRIAMDRSKKTPSSRFRVPDSPWPSNWEP